MIPFPLIPLLILKSKVLFFIASSDILILLLMVFGLILIVFKFLNLIDPAFYFLLIPQHQCLYVLYLQLITC